MQIHDVTILNFKAPGDEWWAKVQARPTEEIINVWMELTLSHQEYQELLDRGKKAYDAAVAVQLTPP